MLVNAKKLKLLRSEKNWTQQHLADVCDLSLRTIQRVEKDGVGSNETVAAYAAVFELSPVEITLSHEEFEGGDKRSTFSTRFMGALFLGGLVVGLSAGIGLTLLLLQ